MGFTFWKPTVEKQGLLGASLMDGQYMWAKLHPEEFQRHTDSQSGWLLDTGFYIYN